MYPAVPALRFTHTPAPVFPHFPAMASAAPGTAEDPTADNPAHAGSGTLDSDGFEKCLAAEALPEGSRKLVRLSTGRGVLLLRHGGQVFAMDHACYHHGAPLATGDIGEQSGAIRSMIAALKGTKLNCRGSRGKHVPCLSLAQVQAESGDRCAFRGETPPLPAASQHSVALIRRGRHVHWD